MSIKTNIFVPNVQLVIQQYIELPAGYLSLALAGQYIELPAGYLPLALAGISILNYQQVIYRWHWLPAVNNLLVVQYTVE